LKKIWFTSDWHLNHKNICRGVSSWASGYRDFDTLAEMNDCIIDNLNKVVPRNDCLYMLGDVIFGDKSLLPDFISRINCKEIHLIYGNHDEKIQKNHDFQALFASTACFREVWFGKTLLTLSHYPLYEWKDSPRRYSIHLHGHCHGNLKEAFKALRMDVGVDTNNFKPYSFDQIEAAMASIEVDVISHHS
jgi:calcineurin-like phosphoesterase family protein